MSVGLRRAGLARAGARTGVILVAAVLSLTPDTAAYSAEVQSVVVGTPGPGHSTEWSADVGNPSGVPADAVLTVLDVGGTADRFGDLLSLTVRSGSGSVLLARTSLASLADAPPVSLGAVGADDRVVLRGSVDLASTAPNAYQGLETTITLRVSVVGNTPGGIAATGLTVSGAVAVALILTAGSALISVERARSGRRFRCAR